MLLLILLHCRVNAADAPRVFAARQSSLHALRCSLFLPPDKDAEELINKEPALLFVELDAVVSDIRRLMPSADPRTVRCASTLLPV